jgi:hypothetical protein
MDSMLLPRPHRDSQARQEKCRKIKYAKFVQFVEGNSVAQLDGLPECTLECPTGDVHCQHRQRQQQQLQQQVKQQWWQLSFDDEFDEVALC